MTKNEIELGVALLCDTEVAVITVKIVSLRQNCIGHNKTCADVILPKDT